ncbi:MAG: hypothetical protein L3J51_07735 [Cocleimonas sp.]|nr:hypothetical protein [Cocleimonas sp.]
MTTSNKTNPKKLSNQLWTIVAVLVFAVFLTMGYKFKDFLSPEATVTATLNESCDLRKGRCSSALPGGGKVVFSIHPKNIPLLSPLQLDVEIEGVEVSNIDVDFVGIGMDMGYNRSKLKAVEKTHFTGNGMLSICARSKMDWEARVSLQTEKGLIIVPFRFFTLK